MIEAGADERAVMLVGGEADSTAEPIELFTLYVLRPATRRALASASGTERC